MQKRQKSENKGSEVQGLYTSPRTSWDHYNALLCHCHPALVNLCQGHTHILYTHTSNLHSYCYIYCTLTNTISHIPLNWIHRYTHASNLHLLENTVKSKLHMCTSHELHTHTHWHTLFKFSFTDGKQSSQDTHMNTKLVLKDVYVFTQCVWHKHTHTHVLTQLQPIYIHLKNKRRHKQAHQRQP